MFKQLGIKESSLKAIERLGFEEPTEIQAKSVPLLLERDIDFIGQAQTGTGKTAAFVLPLLEKIDYDSKDIQALIIAPTRELANQIQEEIDKLSHFEPVRSISVYGGTSVSMQIKDIKRAKPQIVVGTPGRLIDLIDRGVLKLGTVSHVILDEADEMLDMGFFDDVQRIVEEVADNQIWMFSATMPKPILNLVKKHFSDPEIVRIERKELTSEAVDQQYVLVRRGDQTEALCRYLDFHQDMYAIVFCRTKIGTQELSDELNARGYPSDCLHGDMSQDQRDLTMKKFKDKKINLLVCTDVAARGIDVNDLTHVVNFGLPQDNESYVHRIGRTGRGGKKGIALSVLEKSEMQRVKQIERITKAAIEKVKLPQLSEIKQVLIKKAFNQFQSAVNTEIESELYSDFSTSLEGLEREELVKGIYNFICGASLKRYQKAKELDLEIAEKNAKPGFDRFFVTLGKMDHIEVPDLLRFFSDQLNIRGKAIGRIDIKDKFCFIELPNEYKNDMLELDGLIMYNDKKVAIELSKASGLSSGGRSRSRGGFRSSRGNSGPRRSGAGPRSASGGSRSGGSSRGRSGGAPYARAKSPSRSRSYSSNA